MTNFFGTNRIILGLLLCSASLLLTVFYFEYILGFLPCKLCVWQRLPHAMVVLLALITLIFGNFRFIISMICSSFIFSGFILAGYHVGIEYNFWVGPQSCSGSVNLRALSSEAFLETILKAPITRCDEITWSFLNVSMAGWNFLVSLFLTIAWSWTTLEIFNNSKI